MGGDEILELGEIELDLFRREIRRRGQAVDVQPRIFDLLVYLVEHRERVVTKAELLECVWGGDAVVPDVLPTAFYSLRRALGDDPRNPVYVRTVHRVGYRFIADVKRRDASSRFPSLDARHALFVGRDTQKRLFGEMLAGGSPVQLLFVYGLPGIGKTTLLQELAYLCRSAGQEHIWLSGETAGPFVDTFLRALAARVGCPSTFEDVCNALTARPRVLFIDDVHLLHGVHEWMRQELWPALPSSVRLVLAGRQRPGSRWTCDPAWSRTARVSELSGLGVDETRTLLSRRGASVDVVETLWRRTRGHPLALALAADVLGHGQGSIDLLDAPYDVDALVNWFTGHIADRTRLRSLEAACVVDEVCERSLGAIASPDDAAEGIQWLSTLPFVNRAGDVLRVHALVRDAIVARLARRDSTRLADLLDRAHRFGIEEFQRVRDPEAKLRAVQLLVSIGRHHPALRANYVASDAGPQCTVQPSTSRDHAWLLESVRRHEGEPSETIVQRWLAHPASRIWSVRDESEVPAGFLMTLRLELSDLGAAETAGDPLVASLLRVIAGTDGARPDDEILIHRTLVTRDDYQAPSVITRHLHEVKHFAFIREATCSVRLAHVVSVYGDELWETAATVNGLSRLRECEITIGSRRFVPFYGSLRETSIEAWFARACQRVVEALRAAAAG